MTQENNHTVRAVQRAYDILNTLKEMDGAGVTELSEQLDLSKSTVHNHLSTLRASDMVTKKRGKYYLGFECLTLGGYLRDNCLLYQLARDSVNELAQETGELAVVAVEEHGECIYIYRGIGSKAVTIDAYVGQRVPMHCTATGKSILAHLPEEQINTVIDQHGLTRETKNTITSQEELITELQIIREQGYAVDDEERITGMRGIAAPIIEENTDTVLGTIAITGPTHRMKSSDIHGEIQELVKRTARVVEINASYS